MIITAAALLVLGVALAEPVSRALAAARWPERDPAGAVLLWQAVGLAGGLALLGAGLLYGLVPLGGPLPAALARLAGDLGAGSVPDGIGLAQLLALAATAALAARLLSVLVATTVRTLRARRRHRELLDLLASPSPEAAGAHVLDHPRPVAYCLPGLRSRLVLSAGAVTRLTSEQLSAVIRHERAHLAERHDLVVLPFVAWAAAVRWLPGVASARHAVATLIEMRADDLASRQAGAAALAGALRTIGGAADQASLTSFSAATSARIARVDQPPQPLPAAGRFAVRAAAVALVAAPTAAVLLIG